MKITVIAVGKIKERFFEAAISEYAKRLSRYCKLEIVQVADEKTPDRQGLLWRNRSRTGRESGFSPTSKMEPM